MPIFCFLLNRYCLVWICFALANGLFDLNMNPIPNRHWLDFLLLRANAHWHCTKHISWNDPLMFTFRELSGYPDARKYAVPWACPIKSALVLPKTSGNPVSYRLMPGAGQIRNRKHAAMMLAACDWPVELSVANAAWVKLTASPTGYGWTID